MDAASLGRNGALVHRFFELLHLLAVFSILSLREMLYYIEWQLLIILHARATLEGKGAKKKEKLMLLCSRLPAVSSPGMSSDSSPKIGASDFCKKRKAVAQ